MIPTQLPSHPPTASKVRFFDSGIQGGTSWSGNLIASTDYDSNTSEHPIAVHLVASGHSDWFIGFDGSQVTIAKVKDGQNYIKGTLPARRSASISNWRKSGLDLRIKVGEINTDAAPAYASVEIIFG